MYDIITIGEILVEVLADKCDQTFTTPGILLGPYPSGAPAIAIDQAARMGASTAIIAKIGTDDFGLLNKERLKQSGVDISHIVETTSNSTGVAFVTYYKDGNRKFIFHFTNAACGELAPSDINETIFSQTKYLHIMGCSITGSPSLREAIMKSIRLAKSHGVKISFDPNIRPELLQGKIMDYYTEIINSSDIILTGKNELQFLFNTDLATTIQTLLTQKDRIIVIKDGKRSTHIYSRTDAFSVPAFPTLEVDPTGAGDSFDGTFLSLLCQGFDLRTAACYGNAAGALAVSKRGPMEGNTFKKDVEQFMQTHPEVIPSDLQIPYTFKPFYTN